jgi:hypothetical protein
MIYYKEAQQGSQNLTAAIVEREIQGLLAAAPPYGNIGVVFTLHNG